MLFTGKLTWDGSEYHVDIMRGGMVILVQRVDLTVITDETELKALMKEIVTVYKDTDVVGPLDAYLGIEYSESDMGFV